MYTLGRVFPITSTISNRTKDEKDRTVNNFWRTIQLQGRIIEESNKSYAQNFTPKFSVQETPDQYTITADVPGVDKSDIEITVNNFESDKILITIKDFGAGMDASQIKEALVDYSFVPYDTNMSDSIELKLPIVLFLIKQQNGTININSTKGLGTTVTIIF